MTSRVTLLALVRGILLLAAALTCATLLPRLGVPQSLTPNLVIVVVASGALLRGPASGGLLGLAAGWVVDLVPPAGSPLGLTALLYAVAGAAAGGHHRDGGRSSLVPVVAVLTAASVAEASHVVVTVLGDGLVDLPTAASRLAVTLAVGLLLSPLLIRLEQALVRRRLA